MSHPPRSLPWPLAPPVGEASGAGLVGRLEKVHWVCPDIVDLESLMQRLALKPPMELCENAAFKILSSPGTWVQ